MKKKCRLSHPRLRNHRYKAGVHLNPIQKRRERLSMRPAQIKKSRIGIDPERRLPKLMKHLQHFAFPIGCRSRGSRSGLANTASPPSTAARRYSQVIWRTWNEVVVNPWLTGDAPTIPLWLMIPADNYGTRGQPSLFYIHKNHPRRNVCNCNKTEDFDSVCR